MFPYRIIRKKAWLLWWIVHRKEYFEPFGEPMVAGALDARVSRDQVERTMVHIHSAAFPAMMHEWVGMFYRRSVKRFVSHPEGRLAGVYEDWPRWDNAIGRCSYGSNPSLNAEIVEDLCFDVLDTERETAYWKRPEIRRYTDTAGSWVSEGILISPPQYWKVERTKIEGDVSEIVTIGDEAKRPKSLSKQDHA